MDFNSMTKEDLIIKIRDNEAELEKMRVLCERKDLMNRVSEKALHSSRAFLNEIGRMAKVGGWELNVESGVVSWTNEVYRIHEVEPDYDISLNNAISFYAAESRQLIEEAVHKAIATGEPYDLELEIITAKGNRRWIHALGKANYSEGKIVSISGTFQDIDDRKKIEQELANEKFLFNALMDHLPDSIYFKDLNSRFIRINRACSNSNHFSDPEQAIGKSDFDLFTEEHARQAFNDEQNIIKSAKPLKLEEKETRENRADRWVSTVKAPLLNSEGLIIGTFGISRDISEQKRNEEQLFFLANAFKSISECVSITDMNDNIIFLNEAFLKTYGYSENELNGKSIAIFRSLNNDPDIVKEILPSTIDGGWRGEIFNVRKDNSEFPVSLVTSVIKNDKMEPIALIGIATDITLRKIEEDKIKMMNEKLHSLNAEKDKFFSILAHDLKSPLSAFVVATQILNEDIQTMSIDDIREITLSMKTSANSLYCLLENLLEWSLMIRGKMDCMPEKILVKSKIEKSIDVLSENARKKGVEICVTVDDNLSVFADTHMFDSIIRNLVSNAIKFTTAGGKVTITAFRKDEKNSEICVNDTGIGIPQQIADNLFSLTEKTNRTGTGGEPSTGLGLLLCREFIVKHGGELKVESEVGQGSSFIFNLPC